MSTPKLPPCPPQLKAVQHYLKLANDYDGREVVISYWARLYALQSALKIDRKSTEAKALLTSLMDWLEAFKKEHHDNEGITSDVAGQAVIENEAHKLFTKADSDDRGGIFNKNVVKTFYTCGVLFDIIEVFGELTDEIASQRKYAKWKATYIHKCLRNGETPIPGPIGGEEPMFGDENDPYTFDNPRIGFPSIPSSNDETSTYNQDLEVNAGPRIPSDYSTPASQTDVNVVPHSTGVHSSSSGVTLTPDCYAKAQKYCKYAISSMDYEDAATAISYLTKSLNLLTIGKET